VERQSKKTVGITTIAWDSGIVRHGLENGRSLELQLHWVVDAGAAAFARVRPRSQRLAPGVLGAAVGELVTVDLLQDTSRAGDDGLARVWLRFPELEPEVESGMPLGRAHLSLDLLIDEDGEGILGREVAYAVNVRVDGASPPLRAVHSPGVELAPASNLASGVAQLDGRRAGQHGARVTSILRHPDRVRP
jgi:hypothetical protein